MSHENIFVDQEYIYDIPENIFVDQEYIYDASVAYESDDYEWKNLSFWISFPGNPFSSVWFSLFQGKNTGGSSIYWLDKTHEKYVHHKQEQ